MPTSTKPKQKLVFRGIDIPMWGQGEAFNPKWEWSWDAIDLSGSRSFDFSIAPGANLEGRLSYDLSAGLELGFAATAGDVDITYEFDFDDDFWNVQGDQLSFDFSEFNLEQYTISSSAPGFNAWVDLNLGFELGISDFAIDLVGIDPIPLIGTDSANPAAQYRDPNTGAFDKARLLLDALDGKYDQQINFDTDVSVRAIEIVNNRLNLFNGQPRNLVDPINIPIGDYLTGELAVPTLPSFTQPDRHKPGDGHLPTIAGEARGDAFAAINLDLDYIVQGALQKALLATPLAPAVPAWQAAGDILEGYELDTPLPGILPDISLMADILDWELGTNLGLFQRSNFEPTSLVMLVSGDGGSIRKTLLISDGQIQDPGAFSLAGIWDGTDDSDINVAFELTGELDIDWGIQQKIDTKFVAGEFSGRVGSLDFGTSSLVEAENDLFTFPPLILHDGTPREVTISSAGFVIPLQGTGPGPSPQPQPPPPPPVPGATNIEATVIASKPLAREGAGSPGEFEFRLSEAAPAGGVALRYTVSGTANLATDAQSGAPSGTAYIAAGQRAVKLPLVFRDDGLKEIVETVTITLVDAIGTNSERIAVGAAQKATVVVLDGSSVLPPSLPPPSSADIDATVVKSNVVAAREGINRPGEFTFSLSEAAPAGGVTLEFAITGTADVATDTQSGTFPTSVYIPAGRSSVTLPVRFKSDSVYEGPSETLTVTLTQATGANADRIDVGAARSATVSVRDSEPAPNPDRDNAVELVFRDGVAAVNDRIEVPRDTDWFKAVLYAGRRYQIEVESSGSDPLEDIVQRGIEVYEEHGTRSERTSGYATEKTEIGERESLIFVPKKTGTYNIEYGDRTRGTETGDYTLRILDPSSLATGDTPADSTTTKFLPVAGTVTDRIEAVHDIDWIKVTLEAERDYSLKVTPGFGIESFHRADGSAIEIRRQFFREDDAQMFTPDKAGDYYVAITQRYGAHGEISPEYTLSLTDNTPVDNSPGRNPELSGSDQLANAIAAAVDIQRGISIDGRIEHGDDFDVFKVRLHSNEKYRITVTGGDHPENEFTLTNPYVKDVIRASDGRSRNDAIVYQDDSIYASTIQLFSRSGGDYYIVVSGLSDDDVGRYELNIDDLNDDDWLARPGGAGEIYVGDNGLGYIGEDREDSVSVRGTDTDWFEVELQAGRKYQINMVGVSDDSLASPFVKLKMRDGRGPYEDAPFQRSSPGSITFTPEQSGYDYWVEAGSEGSGNSAIGRYTVAIEDITVPGDDDYAADITTDGVLLISETDTTTASGTLELPGDRDWFQVSLKSGYLYDFYARGGGHDVIFSGFYSPTGSKIPGIHSGSFILEEPSGIYYVEVASRPDYSTSPRSDQVSVGEYTIRSRATRSVDSVSADISTTAALSDNDRGGLHWELYIDFWGDVDWAKVELESGWTYRIDAEGSSHEDGTLANPLLLGIYDSAGALIPDTYNDDGGAGLNARLVFSPAKTGTFYLAYASSEREQTGDIYASVTPLKLSDANDISVGNLFFYSGGNVGRVEVGDTGVTENIETPDDQDWFRVVLQAGQSYRIAVDGVATIKGIADRSGDRLTLDANIGSDAAFSNAEWFFTPSTDGRYRIIVGAESVSATGGYKLLVTEAADDFAADRSTTGRAIVDGTVSGAIETPDDRDFFRVDLKRGQYTVELSGAVLEIGAATGPRSLRPLNVYDKDGNLLALSAPLERDDNGDVRSFFAAPVDGVYYIEVQGASAFATGRYSLNLIQGNQLPTGDIVIQGATQRGQLLTANTDSLADGDEIGAFSYQWQIFTNGAWTDIASATEKTLIPSTTEVGYALRVKVSWTDGKGTEEEAVSAQTALVASASAIVNDMSLAVGLSDISEAAAEGDRVGTVVVTAADGTAIAASSLRYTVSDARFVVRDGILQIAADAQFDYETEPLVTLNVLAVDKRSGREASQQVTFSLQDAYEVEDSETAPEFRILTSSGEVEEGGDPLHIYIQRIGDLETAAQLRWEVLPSGRNPVSSEDFSRNELPSGTLNFASYQSQSVIDLELANDGTTETAESFRIRLNLVSGEGKLSQIFRSAPIFVANSDPIEKIFDITDTGSSVDNVITLGSDLEVDAAGAGGDDHYVVTAWQAGAVSIRDSIGSNVVSFDQGVEIVGVSYSVAENRLTVMLGTGARLDVYDASAHTFQLGDVTGLSAPGFVTEFQRAADGHYLVEDVAVAPASAGDQLDGSSNYNVLGTTGDNVFAFGHSSAGSGIGAGGSDTYVMTRWQRDDVLLVDDFGRNTVRFDSGVEIISVDTHDITGSLVFTLANDVQLTVLGGTGSAWRWQLGDGVAVDTESLLNFLGNQGFVIPAGFNSDIIGGTAGADRLTGTPESDWIRGHGGDDVLESGEGADILEGGAGNDRFVFSDIEQGDRILDFASGDTIDLSGIDADSTTAGHQEFTFRGTTAFSGAAGELRYQASGKDLTVQADIDGDGIADLQLFLSDESTLTSAAFQLRTQGAGGLSELGLIADAGLYDSNNGFDEFIEAFGGTESVEFA